MGRLDWLKLHSKILRSSIWLEEPMTRLVWICCLADSESDGAFHGSEDMLARAWNLPAEDVRRGLAVLCAPDPNSETPDHDGRRVERTGPNSWLVLNKARYNQRAAEPPGASTPRVRRHRAAIEPATASTDFEEFWSLYPRKVGKEGQYGARAAWEKLTVEARGSARVAVEAFGRAWSHPGADKTKCPHPATWLNQGRWQDDPADAVQMARGGAQGIRQPMRVTPQKAELDAEAEQAKRNKLADEKRRRDVFEFEKTKWGDG